MHYYKSNNEIMQYCIVSNDIALIMHYRALLKRSGTYTTYSLKKPHEYDRSGYNLYIDSIANM